MNFDPFVHDRLIVIRLRHPSAETSAAMAELIARRHRQLGAPLMFALIIGTDCSMPEPDARRQLAADQAELGSRCFCMRTVILGRELRQALVRSLVTASALGKSDPSVLSRSDPGKIIDPAPQAPRADVRDPGRSTRRPQAPDTPKPRRLTPTGLRW